MVGALKNKESWLAKDKAMMIRRTKSEVLSELPPKQYIDVEIELHKEQMKHYADLRSEDDIEPMVFATRARQIADCQWDSNWEVWEDGKSAKLDWLLEWLDSRGYIDGSMPGKVVIASQFSKVLRWLNKMLTKAGVVSTILDGQTPQRERDEIQARFQDKDDELRVVLLSGQMGVGITLDTADDLIMFDSPYDPDKVEQIEDRVHRASNMHHVTIWNLIGKATIDQAIMAKVSKRYHLTRSLLDGSRGIAFEKEIIDRLTKEGASDADA
jgi:SNF2 family DNA or RNA helicase